MPPETPGKLISDPMFWTKRIQDAPDDQLHWSIFKCPRDRWERIEAKHRTILVNRIKPNESILDVGCGYGRLLSLMLKSWKGGYTGVDLCPDFLQMARIDYPKRLFVECNILDIESKFGLFEFDWAVMISIRPMVKRNLGDETWAKMEVGIRKVAKRLLFLEYDENDQGSVE